MASFGIGAKLRQERLGRGLTIDDVSRDTRIAPRFLEAIEADQFESLPGLVFTRNFVRQFALSLKLNPQPLLAELPKQDESTVRLPEPPSQPRFSYSADRRLHSAFSSGAWLLLAVGAATAAWFHFNRSANTHAANPAQPARILEPVAAGLPAAPVAVAPAAVAPEPVSHETPSSAVQVIITAHQTAWIQVSADGKTSFTGTLQPDETKEIGAAEQVKLLAGNAGALTISLNGKTLDPIGPLGQVRSVRLTAEGPELLSKAPSPPPDPL